MCITSLPSLPRNMGKEHLALVPMTSLVPRIPKPNWVSQKVVIASNWEVCSYDCILPQFLSGLWRCYQDSACLATGSLLPPSLARPLLTLKERGPQPQAWSSRSSSPRGTQVCPAQGPLTISVHLHSGGSRSGCSHICMAGNIPRKHPEMTMRKVLLFREGWGFSCPKKEACSKSNRCPLLFYMLLIIMIVHVNCVSFKTMERKKKNKTVALTASSLRELCE